MLMSRAIDLLTNRGYQFASILPSALEALPELPGVYVVFASDQDRGHVIGILVVPDPWLRTDVDRYLARSDVIAEHPAIVAYRSMEQELHEDTARLLARLAAEQAAVRAALRALA